MGWFTATREAGDQKAIDFLRDQLSDPRHEIVDHSVRGRVAYLAIKFVPEDRVYCLVCLLSKEGGVWSYKPIDETFGPYYHGCPKRIINKLSPTDSLYAIEWRRKCLAK